MLRASGSQDLAVDLYGDALSQGALVGPYIVEALVHRGPMAALYRAKDGRGGRVAVKLLNRAFTHHRGALVRFSLEADALRRVAHPAVVRLVDEGAMPDGRPYLALEWLEGRDLGALLAARGALPLPEAVKVLSQLVPALGKAHREGLVHRDLKTQNVMVVAEAPELTVKLLDFGVAKELDRGPDAGLTSTGVQLGTPVAMAPEQIRGQATDARTDVYALGVLLHQLVTGRPPFEAGTLLDLEELHLHGTAPRASSLAGTPPALDGVIATCLAKRPEERFADVESFLAAVEDAARGQAARAVPALAVLVELRARTETDADAEKALDLMDVLVEHARAAFVALGLTVGVEGPGLMIGVAPLPRAEMGAHELARKRAALSRLAAELRQAALGMVDVRIAGHVAEAEEVVGRGGRMTVRARALMSPAAWRTVAREGVEGTEAFFGGG